LRSLSREEKIDANKVATRFIVYSPILFDLEFLSKRQTYLAVVKNGHTNQRKKNSHYNQWYFPLPTTGNSTTQANVRGGHRELEAPTEAPLVHELADVELESEGRAAMRSSYAVVTLMIKKGRGAP
jgi:hypothetical protein